MPSIDENFKLVKYIIKKNLNGDLSDNYFNMLIKQANYSYLSYLLGATQSYQPGRPISRVEIGNNQHIAQKLSPLIDEPSTLTIDGTGHAPFPADFIAVNAMYKTDLSKVKFVGQDSLSSHLDDPIDPVATYPIYLIEKNKFQFYPITLGSAKISYVRKPVDPKWNYTVDANGRHVYNPTGSQDLVWGETEQLEVIARVLKAAGVNLQSAGIMQYANEIEKAGQ